MAVAMEVSWRGGGGGDQLVRKKRAWSADAHQLMQRMMGQLKSKRPELTLDLLGTGADFYSSSSCVFQLSQGFDLQPHPEEPLPIGWEKVLDLQAGKLFYVNQATGVSTFDDPRTRSEVQTKPLAHEFLGSKRSELETLRASSSSSSGSPHPSGRDSLQLWSLQLDDRRDGESSDLGLDLNLSFASRPRPQGEQAVCTMQMVENALRRSASSPRLRRETPSKPRRHKHNSISSSFSNSTRSDPGNSPSTSSASSGSSTSSLPGANPRSAGACAGMESVKAQSAPSAAAALVMGACTRCLMYVMLNKGDPRCPRCESKVPFDFAPPSKKQRSGGDHRRR